MLCHQFSEPSFQCLDLSLQEAPALEELNRTNGQLPQDIHAHHLIEDRRSTVREHDSVEAFSVRLTQFDCFVYLTVRLWPSTPERHCLTLPQSQAAFVDDCPGAPTPTRSMRAYVRFLSQIARTVDACHFPPRLVATPRAVNSRAMSVNGRSASH
jgi:hypothetical protein